MSDALVSAIEGCRETCLDRKQVDIAVAEAEDVLAALAAAETRIEELRGVLRMARPMYRESELGHGGIPTEQSWVISNYERRAALSGSTKEDNG